MTEEIKQLINNGYFVGVLDGAKSNNIKSFLINIAHAFRFPDYYGENINAFLECISDLDWLSETNYALIINNSDLFMSSDTAENKAYIIKLLEDVSKEWSNVPNYTGEDNFRKKAIFKVIYC